MSAVQVVCDACMLIYYLDVDKNIIRLFANSIASILLPSAVLDEISGLSLEEAKRLGITVVKPTIGQLGRIQTRSERRGLLSSQDWACFFFALDFKCPCVTNDGPLKAACKQEGVSAVHVFDIMLPLVASDIIGADRAISVAKKIRGRHPIHIPQEAVTIFISLVEELETGQPYRGPFKIH